ncbi:MAG: baseplate J/gp47 family protein, partial [Fretibacterium sp.]|nr:baseplate J/gp47 family protein [Fretibacterium sp.]
MTKSDLFPGLDDISFAETDPATIEREIITLYETLTGRSLAKGDPVRLFLESIALVIIQQRTLIDYTGKQNLLAYAEAEHLDHLSAYLGVTRLAASSAVTTLKFTLSEGQPAAVIIPAGTRASPGGGEILFATVEDHEIPAGETEALILAQCTTVGTAGNGFV